MGQGSSSNSATAAADFPRVALHCLRVAAGSPADQAGLQAFFDFLVGVEIVHRRRQPSSKSIGDVVEGEEYYEPIGLSLDPEELSRVLDENEEREIGLRVYNAKERRIRYVTLTPSRNWSSTGGSCSQPSRILGPSLLGLSLKRCDPSLALGQVWHVLDVLEGSPAESAGLVPHGDYVLGWSEGPLEGEQDFYDLVEGYTDRPLRLYVYSADLDNIREVVLIPNREWGGEGLLGCGIGYGLLHRIPPPETVLPSSVPLGVAARPESIPKNTPTASNAANVPTVGSGAGNAVREDADDGYFLNPVVQAT